ncbi:hypothetical protein CROQUDRAFT_95422 [Cronartium quercuum f. sp. fusiforme G11]|uniref:Uncharacterized protein n=1 Tax=Cronartium quercuum f. sp. fusiforme G11 TaxID=708437 RepID=A0A9P6NH58_9BASI|nr:hypothetical protein CROQUDRAFT_95422 [Cronartium quercuum f. sp. fusiforme G11]
MTSSPNQRRMTTNRHQLISIPSSPPSLSRSVNILNRVANTNDDVVCPPLRSFLRLLLRRIRLLGFILCVFFGLIYFTPSHFRNLLSQIPPTTLSPVTRDVLNRLDKLQASFDPADDDQPFEPIGTLDRTDSAMPIVTSLPGKPVSQHTSSPSRPLPPNPVPAEELDRVICPTQSAAGLPCAFLVPGFVGEQETKAQIHLHQLGLLALNLNRTLVLPNVSKSRMGTCPSYPFDLYYHNQALTHLGIPTITYSDFLNWTLTRNPSPSAQLVAILDGKNTYGDRPSDSVRLELGLPETVFPTKPERNICLGKGKSGLNFTSFYPLTLISPERWHNFPEVREHFGTQMVNSLSVNQEKSDKPNPLVLVLNYDLRHPVFDPQALNHLPFAHFAYAPVWTTLAAILARALPPFVALHWRQETLGLEILERCTRSLIPRLRSLKSTFPSLRALYVSTDYPIEDVGGGVPHSGTFSKLITPTHHRIMRDILGDFKAEGQHGLELVTFNRALHLATFPTTLVQKLLSLPNIAENVFRSRVIPGSGTNQELLVKALSELDTGLVGIIEKLLVVRANIFLTGIPGECSKLSSFTHQIVEQRLNLIDDDDERLNLWNVVEYWDAK